MLEHLINNYDCPENFTVDFFILRKSLFIPFESIVDFSYFVQQTVCLLI